MANNQTAEQIAEAAANAAKQVEHAAAEIAAAAAKAASNEEDAKAKTKTVTLVGMSAVFGDVYHPFTHAKFATGEATEHENDAWTKAQIEAGKLVLA